jgi:hypothetical protein
MRPREGHSWRIRRSQANSLGGGDLEKELCGGGRASTFVPSEATGGGDLTGNGLVAEPHS